MNIIIKRYIPGIIFSVVLNAYSQHITNNKIKLNNKKYDSKLQELKKGSL